MSLESSSLLERQVIKVRVRDYKSIASCEVDLLPLSIFVGPNGTGKSSFVDALRLIADALRYSLGHALQERGGFGEIRRRTTTTAKHFAVIVDFRLPGAHGKFGFAIARKNRSDYVVDREICALTQSGMHHYYELAGGKAVQSSVEHPPDPIENELYLSRMAGIEPFRQVFQFLSNMTFYNPSVERIRELQTADDGKLLKRDGSNIASVLKRLESTEPQRKQMIDEYLKVLVPQIEKARSKILGPKLTIEFLQQMPGTKPSRRFLAESMSDGTLRGLGVLVALLQGSGASLDGASLVGVEEPELALSAGAFGGLTDALLDAQDHIQTLVATHSSDLLDSHAISFKNVFAVELVDGETHIGQLDEACQSALVERAFTMGELLRMGQATPKAAERQTPFRFPRSG